MATPQPNRFALHAKDLERTVEVLTATFASYEEETNSLNLKRRRTKMWYPGKRQHGSQPKPKSAKGSPQHGIKSRPKSHFQREYLNGRRYALNVLNSNRHRGETLEQAAVRLPQWQFDLIAPYMTSYTERVRRMKAKADKQQRRQLGKAEIVDGLIRGTLRFNTPQHTEAEEIK